jgi:hypothetical protein
MLIPFKRNMYKVIKVWVCGITKKLKNTKNETTWNMAFLFMVNLLN